jgi:enoyl-CoA hydratase
MFAMPETGIGLFPDVGATYVLPRLPGKLGHYLGLTGARLGTADCLYSGIGTGFVPAERLDALETALAETALCAEPATAVDGALARFQADPGPAPLAGLRARIDACFGQPSVPAILAALEVEASGWGTEQLEELATKSPTSLAVTFRQLCKGATLGFDSAMRLEYRLVHRFMEGHDFREGVRAMLVDKDRRPRWRPQRLADVSDAMVEAYFAPLTDGDLLIEN